MIGSGRSRRAAFRAGLLLAGAGIAGASFLDFCHLLFDCGCVSLWAGAAAFCNIHTPGPPDCPFCAHSGVAYGALVGTVLAQGAVLFVPGPLGLAGRALLALLAFPVVMGGVGVLLGLLVGYRA